MPTPTDRCRSASPEPPCRGSRRAAGLERTGSRAAERQGRALVRLALDEEQMPEPEPPPAQEPATAIARDAPGATPAQKFPSGSGSDRNSRRPRHDSPPAASLQRATRRPGNLPAFARRDTDPCALAKDSLPASFRIELRRSSFVPKDLEASLAILDVALHVGFRIARRGRDLNVAQALDVQQL